MQPMCRDDGPEVSVRGRVDEGGKEVGYRDVNCLNEVYIKTCESIIQ